jgi:uncharacterized Fe-S radical SAM superfamily protein PflX
MHSSDIGREAPQKKMWDIFKKSEESLVRSVLVMYLLRLPNHLRCCNLQLLLLLKHMPMQLTW